MKKVLITSLLKDNELYIPYLFKCIAQSEAYNCAGFEFKYLFLTNNNKDNTIELINTYKDKYDVQIVEKNYNEDVFKLSRVARLRILREDLLQEIKKKDFQYLIMLDSDIIFNGKMVEDLIYQYDNSNYDALSANTRASNNPFYYDYFALIDDEGKTPRGSASKQIKFLYKISNSNEKIIKVKSAFAGMFIISKKKLLEKKPSYNIADRESQECEHIFFNKNLNIGIVRDVNPIWLKENLTNAKYARNFNKINKNKSDNRDFIFFFLYFIFLVLTIILAIYFLRSYKLLILGICVFNSVLMTDCIREIL